MTNNFMSELGSFVLEMVPPSRFTRMRGRCSKSLAMEGTLGFPQSSSTYPEGSAHSSLSETGLVMWFSHELITNILWSLRPPKKERFILSRPRLRRNLAMKEHS